MALEERMVPAPKPPRQSVVQVVVVQAVLHIPERQPEVIPTIRALATSLMREQRLLAHSSIVIQYLVVVEVLAEPQPMQMVVLH
jgi:hypothetical protein